METCLGIVIGILILIIGALAVKVHLLRKGAGEIREAFADRLGKDTNTLIDLSTRDGQMRKLADDMNRELRRLRKDRHRFVLGDLELKEAITNVSHDIRTPLTAICGYLELLRQEEKSEAAARYLSVIEDRTAALKQLTEELFCYSMAASERDAQEASGREEVVLNHVLEESIVAYYAVLEGCGVKPHISMPEEKVRRRLNKEALMRIFGNIISNAVKYSDGDLYITLTGEGELTFSNHAAGLDEIQVGRMFERFYTVENGRSGTGLGLSIARTLTEGQNGVITAWYREGVLGIHLRFPEAEGK